MVLWVIYVKYICIGVIYLSLLHGESNYNMVEDHPITLLSISTRILKSKRYAQKAFTNTRAYRYIYYNANAHSFGRRYDDGKREVLHSKIEFITP